jgi:glucose-6-phosphate isomerase
MHFSSRSTTHETMLTKRQAWQALNAHFATMRDLHLRQLFADDPHRGEHMAVEAEGIYFDAVFVSASRQCFAGIGST